MALRIAFFTPLTPLQTALADHSEGLLPYLQQGAEIDLFIDNSYQPTNQNIIKQFKVYSYQEFSRRAADYDLTVYVMGDHPFHEYMHELIHTHPGVLILHDTQLQNYFIARSLRRGGLANYEAEIEYAYGKGIGRRAANLILSRQADRLRGLFPLVERFVEWSLGTIVYNEFAYNDLLARRPHAQVRQLKYHFYLPAGFPATIDIESIKARWGIDKNFIIGTFGLFHSPDKRLDVCLRAFKQFREIRPDARYLLVGDYSSDYDVPGLIRAYGLEDSVTLTGWMDTLEFAQHLCVPDIAIHLRYPHIGGTLYTPLRLLGLGKPTILSDIEPLAEFPEGCCVKIAPDEYEADTLLETLKYLAQNPDFRLQLGENARQFIQQHYQAEQIAREHLNFFEQAASTSPKSLTATASNGWYSQLIRESAAITAQWGIHENNEALLRPIAEAITSLMVED
ncbi:MAG TPA: glycosyltransferase [Anaerolineae bacterium]|nr:glycosyltransferase [Anaerolineae bacterium]